MTSPSTPANWRTRNPHIDPLHSLVARTADGDRTAFRTLYAFLAMQVWRDAVRLLPPADARAVTRSTFVEVWHLARHHLGHDGRATLDWIQAITARHIGDRFRTSGERSLPGDGHDNLKRRELAALLGEGHTTIRTAARTFVRVADLISLPPACVSASWWQPAGPRPQQRSREPEPMTRV